jgi:cell division protein FtsI (penicillin-binding protein 3)
MIYKAKTFYDNSRRRSTQSRWTKTTKRRGAFVFLVGMLFWLLILSRLFYFQVLKGDQYENIASKQHQRHIKLEANRGLIYDRNGRLLTVNLPVESFFAIPESVESASQVARAFAGSSHAAFNKLKKRLKSDSKFVWLKRKVEKKESQKTKSRLGEKKLRGVWVLNETKRYYLNGRLAEDVLGFTDVDNKGLAGVEFQYDRELSGRDGEAMFQRDGHRNSYHITEYPLQQPEAGKSIGLTIDIELQSIMEEELEKGIHLTQADGGSAVLMDPKTGEILAMAYCTGKNELPVKNRTISDNFEPGSTFKIVTAAAALEEEILTPEDSIYAEKGKFRIGRRIIHDVKPYEWLSFKESVIFSSNIALAKIANMVGKERLYRYARDFGLGTETGIDLPGESEGFISPPESWPDFVLSTIAFGQGISLTALQLVCAYAAVANDGVLMRPFVVKAILDEKGDSLKVFRPTRVRRVISPETAFTLVDFLKGVVSYGSGQKAKMEGLEIGGKTGTAQKAKLNGRGYEDGKYIASFVGFFPADDPGMVGLITLDNPKTQHLGGLTAAPVFKNTTLRILALTGKPLLRARANNSSELAEGEMSGQGLNQLCVLRSRETLTFPEEESTLHHKSKSSTRKSIMVPDVLGMTAREAVRALFAEGLPVQLRGSGLVTKQVPKPYTLLDQEQTCLIECQPR